MAPANRRSFSVRVVFPASGWEMIAKVRRRAVSSAIWDSVAMPNFTASALHELVRGLEKLEIFLVLRGILAVDLDPFARARRAGGLERDHVLARELKLRRDRHPEAQPHALAADAGEHPVVHEIGVEPGELLRDHAGQLREDRVDLRLAGRLRGVGLRCHAVTSSADRGGWGIGAARGPGAR